MTRVLGLVCLFLSFLVKIQAQCPTLVLSSASGSTCGTTAVTVSGNTFGGSANKVTITENGGGSVSPTSSTVSPFSFKYTPTNADIGKNITITVTTNDPKGTQCSSAKSTYTLTVSAIPGAPVAGTITKPTCTLSTGSVVLNGLPSTGTWTITRKPGDLTTTGTGTTVTISELTAGAYTFTVTNSAGCTSPATSPITIPLQPTPPTAPAQTTDCSLGSGKGVVKVTSPVGTGYTYSIDAGAYQSSVTFSNIADGNHSISVKNSDGCITVGNSFQVLCGCVTPAAPLVGTITPPTCAVPTGSVVINGLPQTGTWTLTRFPGGVLTTGSGPTVTVTGILPGLYNYSVKNDRGCTSGLSANVLITEVSAAPAPPVIGTISQPGTGVPTGSAVLTGLPVTGTWTLKRSPDNVIVSGTGSTITISGLLPGSYNFSVTNSSQCTSGLSEQVTIGQAIDKPAMVITFPPPVCFPSTVDITDPKITTGSTPNLIFSYWTDPSATIPFTTPKAAPSGIWYIKGALANGSSAIEPVMVTAYHSPVANAGPDQILTGQSTVQLDAGTINNNETGLWSVASGTGEFFDPTYPKTSVSGLSTGKNVFVWKITNGVCPASLDSVMITIHEHLIPTLITPNMDGRNDYLVIKGFNASDKIELIVFDRRGVMVFKNENYDNKWNGIDLNGHPLADDTYFYVLKSENGISLSGYLLIRR